MLIVEHNADMWSSTTVPQEERNAYEEVDHGEGLSIFDVQRSGSEAPSKLYNKVDIIKNIMEYTNARIWMFLNSPNRCRLCWIVNVSKWEMIVTAIVIHLIDESLSRFIVTIR